jgi:hypothetical protein
MLASALPRFPLLRPLDLWSLATIWTQEGESQLDKVKVTKINPPTKMQVGDFVDFKIPMKGLLCYRLSGTP